MQEQIFTGMLQSALKVAVVRETGLQLALSLLNNRQRRYRYRLLAVMLSQPTKIILSVTQCEEEDRAQPGELDDGEGP